MTNEIKGIAEPCRPACSLRFEDCNDHEPIPLFIGQHVLKTFTIVHGHGAEEGMCPCDLRFQNQAVVELGFKKGTQMLIS